MNLLIRIIILVWKNLSLALLQLREKVSNFSEWSDSCRYFEINVPVRDLIYF